MNLKFELFEFKESKKIFKIITKKEKKNLFILFFFMFFSSLLETFSIGILIPLINFLINPDVSENSLISFLPNHSNLLKNTSVFLIIIFFVYLFKYLFLIFYTYFSNKIILQLSSSFKKRLFKNYLKKEYLFHLKNNSALLIRNIQMEVDMLCSNYISPFLSLLLSILTTFFIILLLLFYSFLSTLIVLVIFSLIGLSLNMYVRGKLTFIGKQRQIHGLGVLQNLQQSFSLIKEIKMLDKIDLFLNKYNFHNLKMVFYGTRRGVYSVLPRAAFEYSFIIIVLTSIYVINLNQISVNQFLSILAVYALASFRIMPSLNLISSSYQKIKYGTAAVDTIFKEFQGIDVDKKEDEELKINEELQFKNHVELKDIYFKYSNDKKFILENINLKLNKDSIIGIIGDNASGKSTLINLICGLLKPKKGNILVDSKEIFLNLKNWQKKIGYIPQFIYLIDDTVESNIALGVKKEDRNTVKLEEIMNFTNLNETLKLEDMVGEGGKNISGGQKQKIAIARALYTDPEILIMDEVTSSMDLDSEKEFINKICNKKLAKTIIIISHRIKALENCDMIYRLQNHKLEKINK